MKFMLGFYNKRAVLGGVIATIISGLGFFALGNISGYEAKILIKSSIPGINMLCNTIILASATILTLLLTLLGISSGSKSKLKPDHYLQVLLIAKVTTGIFIAALLLFEIFNLPITEAENVSSKWYSTIYWTVLILSSLLSGSMVSVVLLLYNTIENIIKIVGLNEKDHKLIEVDKKKSDKKT